MSLPEPTIFVENVRRGWRGNSLLLLGFMISALLHLLLGYVFRVATPQVSAPLPDDAILAIAVPGLADDDLLDWIANSDPSNVFRPEEPGRETMAVRYHPSFETALPDIRSVRRPLPEIVPPPILGNVPPSTPVAPPRKAPPPAWHLVFWSKTPGDTPWGSVEIDAAAAVDPSKVRGAVRLLLVGRPGAPAPTGMIIQSSGCENLDALALRTAQKQTSSLAETQILSAELVGAQK